MLICPKVCLEFLFYRNPTVTFKLAGAAFYTLTQMLSMSERVKVCFVFDFLLSALLQAQFPLRVTFHLVGCPGAFGLNGVDFSLVLFLCFSFSFVSHCPLACRDTRPLHSSAFRLVRSFAASFVRAAIRAPLPPPLVPVPLASTGAFRPPPSPAASQPAAVAMAYQAMQKSWFKMPAYSAVYNPAKKDIEAGDKSTKRQQRSGGERVGSGSQLGQRAAFV